MILKKQKSVLDRFPPVMQSLTREVESICMLHKGWLKTDECSHPTIREATLSVTENSKIQAMGQHVCAVLYNKRYVFNKTQLVLRCDAVPAAAELICLGLFSVHKESIQCSEHYLMSRPQWDKATYIKSSQSKALNLNTLHKISLLEQEVIEIPSPVILSISSDDEESGSDDVYADLRPFSMVRQLDAAVQVEESSDYLRQYVQLLLDMVIWRRYFPQDESLMKKSCLYYSRLIKEHHSEMTLLFLSQMVALNGHDVTENLHRARKDRREGEWFIELANTRLYQEWLELEVMLFKEARWYRQQLPHLQEHVAFIRRYMPRPLWPTWLSYTLNESEEDEPLYWIELTDGNYEIRAEWILRVDFDALLLSLPLIKGHTCLSPQIFQTVFMPAMYRCMLDDVRAYLFYVYHYADGANNDNNAQRDQLLSLRNAHHYSREEMKAFDEVIAKYSQSSSATSLFDLAAQVGDISSPVARKMVKKRPEFDTSRIQSSVSWYERHITRADVPDIEDLGNKRVAPPCMQRIFTVPPHLRHTDRMNVIRYLIDMAYTKPEVIEYLCRGHENDGDYRQKIDNTYDSFFEAKRVNQGQTYTQHHSFYCSSLINLPIQPVGHSFMRCVFAEKVETYPRNDYTKQEKESFMSQCGATLKKPTPYLKHPVQYSLLNM